LDRENLLLKPGTLWAKLVERSDRALQLGALLSIPTEFEFIEQDGVRFLVRILANLARKDEAKQVQERLNSALDRSFNPFLPYEEDLFVTDISDTHVCILNKFNVVDRHLLIITRAFEAQENLLTLADFAAMWACLAEFDGLVFYNAGKIAGASQPHKHLQIVSLPLVTSEPHQIPISPLLSSASFQGEIATIPGLPFIHAFIKLDSLSTKSPSQAAEATLTYYHNLLRAITAVDRSVSTGGVGVAPPRRDYTPAPRSKSRADRYSLQSSQGQEIEIQPCAYNLLATREWMLLILRSQESFESISVNSLGFAGTLLVRNQEQMQILKACGPMELLRQVAVPLGAF
jgi:sulfate adenylyltransferase (ADP) / ATP adenylyltransferase